MGLRKKKTLLEQAEGYVEAAIDQARDFVQDTAMPALSDAKEKAAPHVQAGAATVAERATEARQKAAPFVAAGAATVAGKAAEAREYADSKAAELTGKKKKRSKFKTLLLFGGIAGAVAFVAKKMQGSAGGDDGGWQSSYTPSPPPQNEAKSETGADQTASMPSVEEPAPDVPPVPEQPDVPEPGPAADPLSDPMPSESKSDK